MPNDTHRTAWVNLLKEALVTIGNGGRWHWFGFHFSRLPPHPLARSIIGACADCERMIEGLGFQFVKEIAAVSGSERYEPHYDQLIQKLAELLVLRQLLGLDWPQGTKFQHEPVAQTNGKRPELRVVTPDRSFLFEVKAPAIREHAKKRRTNSLQAPGRSLGKEMLENFADGGGVTLARDGPIKDFLLDTDSKFAQFNAVQRETGVLVIVWDDFVYEPITSLVDEHCGLLTPNSFLKDDTGAAVQFPNIDAVVLIRHLNYFFQAAAGDQLTERAHALDFGDALALPNVIIPTGDLNLVPGLVRAGLRALPLDSPEIQGAAEYKPMDLVMWI